MMKKWLIGVILGMSIYLLLGISCTSKNEALVDASGEGDAPSVAAEETAKPIINLQPLADDFLEKADDPNANPNAIADASNALKAASNALSNTNANNKASALKNDPIYGLDKLAENSGNNSGNNGAAGAKRPSNPRSDTGNPAGAGGLAGTEGVAGSGRGAEARNLIRIAEVPPLARSKASSGQQRSLRARSSQNSQNPKSKRPSLSQIRKLYNQEKYRTITKYAFTMEELPQLYYKASAYFQLARRVPKRTREQVEFVRYSKHLYNRIAATTRDPDLKGRSLLWLAVLKWRFPAWSEDLEQQLAPLTYIQRKLTKTRVYNDSLLYAAFIYESHRRYAKAYDYYRKLGQTRVDDWVYDDKISKFTDPKRASQWYLAGLEASRLTKLARLTDSRTVNGSTKAVRTSRTSSSTSQSSTTSSPSASVGANPSRASELSRISRKTSTPANSRPLSSKSRTSGQQSGTNGEESLATKLEEISDFTDTSSTAASGSSKSSQSSESSKSSKSSQSSQSTPPSDANSLNEAQSAEEDSFTFD